MRPQHTTASAYIHTAPFMVLFSQPAPSAGGPHARLRPMLCGVKGNLR